MDLQGLLQAMVNKRASDLHVRAGGPAYLRVDGNLTPAAPDVITAAEAEAMLSTIITPRAKKVYEARGEADFSFQAGEVARFRVNAYKQRGRLCLAVRFISTQIPTLADLRLP